MKKQLVLGRLRRPDEIRALLELYRSGTQSVNQFAQKQGVTPTTIYNWLRRYPTEPTAPATLTEVQLRPLPHQSFKSVAQVQGYPVVFGNGITLRIPLGFDGAEVHRLLQLLAGL